MMNNWDTTTPGKNAREAATIAFCEHFVGLSSDERKKFTLPKGSPAEELAASDAAKRLFATKGSFRVEGDQNPEGVTVIPRKIRFRVYEFEPFNDRDDIVTIVLPKNGTPDQLAEEYYRCSYWPY